MQVGHRPATTDDLAWWSGLTAADARDAVAAIAADLDVDDGGQRTMTSAASKPSSRAQTVSKSKRS